MQTGIVRTADGLLLPGFGPLAMFKILVEVALSPFKRSHIVVRRFVTLCVCNSLSLLYAIQFPVAGTKNTPLSLSTWA